MDDADAMNTNSVNETVEQLDRVLARCPDYERVKRRDIDSIKRKLADADSPEARYSALQSLFDEYSSYSMDTTLLLARRCVAEARAMANDSLLWNATIMEAEGLKGMGDYTGALIALQNIPPQWHDVYRNRIYNRYVSIYYSLADYATSEDDRIRYNSVVEAYRDSLVASQGVNTAGHWLNLAEKNRAHGNYEAAYAYLDSIDRFADDRADQGILSFLRARCLEHLGRTEDAKRLYARAAIIDLSNSVRKYEALQELARIMSDEGDQARAYRYIMRAISDIQASNARSRIQRITRYMPIIATAYTEEQEQSMRNKTVVMCLTGALALALLFSILHIRGKNRRLHDDRESLRAKNAELETLRQRLSEANRSLEESSKIKEQYLGYLFNLCADYIGSLERYRLQLAQRVKSGRVKDIDALLSQPQGAEHLQSFFHKFDSIFLDIFPDFIDKLNGLLDDGYKLEPRPGELLSPELRIYALVRLGINDSTQIAAFLHYSPQTVYNYRFRVRSHSRIPRDKFPQAVMEL